MKDKVDPYLRPIYDALYDFMEGRMVERGLQTGMIEIAPLAFMRGRTLSKAAILLDEAQNATAMQMKMFLTRLGEGSRMMVNGDPTQTDLAPGQTSGLSEAIDLLSGLERVGHVRFRHGDVVRHDLVRQIVEAYESAKANASVARGQLGAMSVRVEFVETSRLWRGALPARALARAGDRARRCAESGVELRRGAEVCVHLVDDADIRALNAQWRGQDAPTNVLSFPAVAAGAVAEARRCSATFSSPSRPSAARPKTRARRSPTISAISWSTAFCICSASITSTDAQAEAMEALEVRVARAARRRRPLRRAANSADAA